MRRKSPNEYPPISDYAYISDCHSCALISYKGSIDWCCMPRVDSDSVFGRILDWSEGGYCLIEAVNSSEKSRRYLEDTLILETTFKTDTGRCRLLDFFPMRQGGKNNPHIQLIRIVEGLEGIVSLKFDIVPRFDYGAIKPWIRKRKECEYSAIGGSNGLLISGNIDFKLEYRHHLSGSSEIKKDERKRLSILFRKPEEIDEDFIDSPSDNELDDRLEETIKWWRNWTKKVDVKGPYGDIARRSAIVLKGLTNAPTGAVAAAPTTSLPETPEGMRNWDYRFSWIRDSVFAVRSLKEIGCTSETDGYRRFVRRASAGKAQDLQIMYGVGGERHLREFCLDNLEGYRGARPVRIGNDARYQKQFDIFGELLVLIDDSFDEEDSLDDDYWEFIVSLVNTTVNSWRQPDSGIWEMRGEPRHFVQSKAMCWVTLHRGIELAKKLGRKVPMEKWENEKDAIRKLIEEKGYDSDRGVFIQAFDRPQMDSSLLLLPIFGFIDYKDERMVRSVQVIRDELEHEGLLYRYKPGSDGMDGEEGVFLACTFWLVECLARMGRRDEAKKVFENAITTCNDLLLFSEEYGLNDRVMLGNFPQGLTHLSLIAAVVALNEIGNPDKC
jgi:GH15 family glucan-1,4-alpha-glucosidase